MNRNRLVFGRAIFLLLTILAFGMIIINEKGGKIFLPKATANINKYIDEKYGKIKNEIKVDSIKYKNRKFIAKIVSKNNKNLYFYITYKEKKLTDTYKEDYYKGKSYLTYLNKKLEKEIVNKTKQECKIKSTSTLDKYTENVRKELLKESNILNIKYYIIEKEIRTDDWNAKNITNEINKYIDLNTNNNIIPKYYTITITDKNDITKSIEISNISENYINNTNKEKIINDVLNKNNSKELNDSKIKYRFLNEEE